MAIRPKKKKVVVCPFGLKIGRAGRSISFFKINLDIEEMQYHWCVCILGHTAWHTEPQNLFNPSLCYRPCICIIPVKAIWSHCITGNYCLRQTLLVLVPRAFGARLALRARCLVHIQYKTESLTKTSLILVLRGLYSIITDLSAFLGHIFCNFILTFFNIFVYSINANLKIQKKKKKPTLIFQYFGSVRKG